MLKKVLAGILSATVIISSAAVATPVMAADVQTVDITYSVYDGEYVLEPTTLTVSADLDDKYADQVGYTDSTDVPTILDATIAAHIALYGEKFYETKKFTMTTDYGYAEVTNSFGKESYAVGYYLNNTSAYGIDVELSSEDDLRYFIYQDATAWSDIYASFNKNLANVSEGESVTLTLTGITGWDASYNPITSALANVSITSNGQTVGTTDANGKVTIKFDKAGVYKICTSGKYNDKAIVSPFCQVTVAAVATAFDKTTAAINAGESVTLTLTGSYYDSLNRTVTKTLASADISANGVVLGRTNENGQITLTFDEAGTYVVYPTGTYNNMTLANTVCKVTVTALDQKISAKTAKKTFKYSKTKKRTFTIKMKNAKTDLVYKSSSSKIKVSESGKVTVAKGTAAGTYKVKVYAKASTKYNKSNTVTIKIKIKK